jgi:hypothetical protein
VTARRFALRRAWLALSLFANLALTSCATDDVRVATLQSCTANEECPATDFCAKASCGDSEGSCQLRPVLCDATSGTSCGCDGVTYWNDCLRMQRGIAASTTGQCFDNAKTCASVDAAECQSAASGASCGRLLAGGPGGPACPADTPGVCWVLPADCGGLGPGEERWQACDGSNVCDDMCAAIRSGIPHRRGFIGICR